MPSFLGLFSLEHSARCNWRTASYNRHLRNCFIKTSANLGAARFVNLARSGYSYKNASLWRRREHQLVNSLVLRQCSSSLLVFLQPFSLPLPRSVATATSRRSASALLSIADTCRGPIHTIRRRRNALFVPFPGTVGQTVSYYVERLSLYCICDLAIRSCH